MKYNLKSAFIFLGILMVLAACNDERNPVPSVPVYEEVWLNTIEAQDLNRDGGYMVTEQGGNKGLIIYRYTSAEFRAFDRTCPKAPKTPASG